MSLPHQSNNVTIVIPVWNALWHVQNLCDDLKETILEQAGSDDSEWGAFPNVDIIFVDNNSTDGAREYLREFCKDIDSWTLIENEQNVGFTVAINQGIAKAGIQGQHFVFMNTDIRCGSIDERGEFHLNEAWLPMLVSKANEDPSIGIIAPRLQNKHGHLCGPDAHVADDGDAWLSHVATRDRGQYDSTRVVKDVQYACVMRTRGAMEEIPFLEESMAIYRSDSYDCRMVQRYGYRDVVVFGCVTMTHCVGASRSHTSFNEGQWAEHDTKAFLRSLSFVNNYKDNVVVNGPIGEMTGYSKLCENIIRGLERNNIRVSTFPVRTPQSGRMVEESLILDTCRRQKSIDWNTLIVCPPHDSTRQLGRIKTMATMFECWETPSDWVPILNQMEYVWTFTEWNKESFTQGGVHRPIHVVDTPIDTDIYHPNIEPFRLRQSRDFNILMMFEWGIRKWPDAILQLCKTFNAYDDVSITVRLNGHDAHKQFDRLLAKMPNRKVPIIKAEPVHEYDMGAFYRAHDLVVTVGAEGIGLPFLEATACGVPATALNWGAGGEIGRNFSGLMIDYDAMVDTTGKIGPIYDGAKIGRPDFSHITSTALAVYENNSDYYSEAEIAAALVHEKCNLKTAGRCYAEMLFNPDGDH